MQTAFEKYRAARAKRKVNIKKNCFLNLDNQVYCDTCKAVLDPKLLCAQTDIYHPGRYDCPHCGSRIFIPRSIATTANSEIAKSL